MAHVKRSFSVIFCFIILLLTVCVVELCAIWVWKYKLDGNRYLSLYAERIASLQRIIINRDTGAIGFAPGTTVVSYNTGEFVDRVQVWFSKELGVGIFDDGIDYERPQKAIVVGDSFGRGVGATSLSKNWVESAEKIAGKFDLLNLSYVGSGIPGYIDHYKRLADKFPHDYVILSFDADSDFLDSIFIRNRLARFTEAADVKRRAIAYHYDEGCERQLHAFYNIKTALAVFEVLRRRSEWAHKVFRDVFPPCPSIATPPDHIQVEQRKGAKAEKVFVTKAFKSSKIIDKNLRRLLEERDLWSETKSGVFRGYHIAIKAHHRERKIANMLADTAATHINNFAHRLEGEGKCLVLVVHPTKPEIYGKGMEEAIEGAVKISDIRYPLNRLIEKVRVPVIDPTYRLRAEAMKNSAPLYYTVDMHYTPRGYNVVGNVVGTYFSNKSPRVCTKKSW